MVGVFYIHIQKQKEPFEIVLGREGGRGKTMEGINLRYIISTYVNIIMYPPLQLLHANKNF
jgi:hypothetical protein